MYNNSTGYPSVTDLIKPYINTEFYTEECCDRGSAAHAAAAAHLQGLYAPKLQPDWQLYVDSFKRWQTMAIDKPVIIEKRFSDPSLGFTGQIDFLGYLKGSGALVLADWKTSATEHKSWRIQIAAYRHLVALNGFSTQRGIGVRLKADGSGAIIKEYPRDYKNDFNIFLGLLNSFKYFNKGY